MLPLERRAQTIYWCICIVEHSIVQRLVSGSLNRDRTLFLPCHAWRNRYFIVLLVFSFLSTLSATTGLVLEWFGFHLVISTYLYCIVFHVWGCSSRESDGHFTENKADSATCAAPPPRLHFYFVWRILNFYYWTFEVDDLIMLEFWTWHLILLLWIRLNFQKLQKEIM
jgi:hypothetical protein